MSLDDVARRLAEPMGRRRAMGVIGGAVFGVAFGGLRPARARAYHPCTTGTHACPHAIHVFCCDSSETCCRTQCCPAGAICVDGVCDYAPCPTGQAKCRGGCCAVGQECVGGLCVKKCRPGTTRCGGGCCDSGSECRSGTCVKRCPPKRVRCGSKCCPKGQRCVKGRCRRCASGREPCGKRCCAKGRFCCNPGKGLCCAKRGGECCFTDPKDTESSGVCCQAPSACAREGTLDGGNVPGKGYVCCPPGRQAPSNGPCCPPGSTAHKDGYRVGVGVPAACCPNDRICGKQCLARARGSGVYEECCGGTPRNVASDPANCGGCGKQCAPGQGCYDGVCG